MAWRPTALRRGPGDPQRHCWHGMAYGPSHWMHDAHAQIDLYYQLLHGAWTRRAKRSSKETICTERHRTALGSTVYKSMVSYTFK
jgi:hypothetical protein